MIDVAVMDGGWRRETRVEVSNVAGRVGRRLPGAAPCVVVIASLA
ncbi:hypothetical protein [Streptomyces adustus]